MQNCEMLHLVHECVTIERWEKMFDDAFASMESTTNLQSHLNRRIIREWNHHTKALVIHFAGLSKKLTTQIIFDFFQNEPCHF